MLTDPDNLEIVMLEKIIRDNSVSFGGIFAHTWCWVTSSSGDYIYRNPDFRESESDGGIDIYCVHGTADMPQSFSRLIERALVMGLPNTIRSITLVAFEGRFQGYGIEHFAEQLADKITGNKHRRVILMGHSRGGLVISYLDVFLASKYGIQVDFVFTVATPFNGSHLAIAPFTWVSESVYQMEVGSMFLKDLGKGIMNSPARYYFFEASCDYIVTTGQSYVGDYVAKYPSSLKTIITSHGHLSIMSSHKLVSEIVQVINDDYDNSKQITPNLSREDYLAMINLESMSLSGDDAEADENNESIPGIFDF